MDKEKLIKISLNLIERYNEKGYFYLSIDNFKDILSANCIEYEGKDIVQIFGLVQIHIFINHKDLNAELLNDKIIIYTMKDFVEFFVNKFPKY